MDTRKIRFVSNRPWLNDESASRPEPISKTIPDWYRKADRFAVNPETGKPWETPDGGGKIPTWKACPAMFDAMSSGYTYRTPCDIEFSEDASGNIQGGVLDPKHQNFLTDRVPLNQFPHPQGYHKKHFAWWADWAVELPEGYSALYTQPLNRFELPFLTTSGIVDNDKVHLPGTMPFFFLKGVTGILPAGTPYAQIIPFRREHWESEIDVSLTLEEMEARNKANSEKYRKPDGGVYLKEVWEKRKYQ
ncbi:MAG TPA: hypothetical protein VMR74_13825 [Gammaproteobacteria bacterium]|nr:hypothetical protein [Gammaproteobacteria bacterium]